LFYSLGVFSLMNIVAKFTSAAPSANQPRTSEPPSPALSPTPRNQTNAHIAWNVAGLTVPGSMDTSNLGLSENQLRRQGLECLIFVLRSLVSWGIAMNKAPDDGGPTASRPQMDDVGRDPAPSESNLDRLSTIASSVEALRLNATTPDLSDDPSRFESARQKKTTLLEGIKKFNSKAKHVRESPSN
jgi:brefeldin A-inhibited guanine nucleotide-exchange protein